MYIWKTLPLPLPRLGIQEQIEGWSQTTEPKLYLYIHTYMCTHKWNLRWSPGWHKFGSQHSQSLPITSNSPNNFLVSGWFHTTENCKRHLHNLQLAPERHLYSPPPPGVNQWSRMGDVNPVVLPKKHKGIFFLGGGNSGSLRADMGWWTLMASCLRVSR